MAALTVAQLIVKLQALPNQGAAVTVTDAAGTNLASLNVTGVVQTTFPKDAPGAGGSSSAGTVQLVGGA